MDKSVPRLGTTAVGPRKLLPCGYRGCHGGRPEQPQNLTIYSSASTLKSAIHESIDAGGQSVVDPSDARGFIGSSKMKPCSTYKGSLYLKWRRLRVDGGIRGDGWWRKGDGRVLQRGGRGATEEVEKRLMMRRRRWQ
ncbi:hypothetical protein LWI29_009827 [Acer saccharum]|uniref:Uncharacterized protein n=1 Tax=Acer saccharum TaxID=4024 RepID=A0AA39RC69_ACESA|nr:hypothetical protein LWI29_009827 [Acer saccharum]